MKNIALGIDNFKELIQTNAYFVDKSLFIQEIVQESAKVVLLPRPRRWGKTLNMSMLQYFLEKTPESNRHLFKGLNVEQHQDVMAHQGKYPVIFIGLKGAKKTTWSACWNMLQDIIASEYKRHVYLLESNLLDEQEKENFNAIVNNNGTRTILELSLKNLSNYLYRYYGQEPYILLDEYDAPIHAGYEYHFYEEIMDFIKSFLGAALKSNDSLKKGVITGVLRISKESIFSDLNNLMVCSIIDEEYADKFGFLEKEVKEMLTYFGRMDAFDEVKKWYNGYKIGSKEAVYNPWSVITYAKRGVIKSHWMRTSDNIMVKRLIKQRAEELRADIENLLLGKTIEKQIDENIVFDEVFASSSAVWSFLLFTGYLACSKVYIKNTLMHASLLIPNNEVVSFYKTVIFEWLDGSIKLNQYHRMLDSLVNGQVEEFKEKFSDFVFKSMSVFDPVGDEPESFYHAFVLGMLISISDTHQVVSNRETGSGRCDVMIIPKDLNKIGIIVEFKKAKDDTDEVLKKAVNDALNQIEIRNYQTELKARGIKNIISLGISFCGKKSLVREVL